MNSKVTSYGYPGDPTPDKYTKAGIGGWDNWLRPYSSAALTKAAIEGLSKECNHSIEKGAKLVLVWPDGYTEVRFFDDYAPEDDIRVDCYRPNITNNVATNFVHGDHAEVTYVPMPNI